MLDDDTRMHRACIGRDLVLLAAPPHEQLEYFNRTGCPPIELFNQWMNWEEMMLPQVIEAGALTPEIERVTSEITESLRKLDSELAAEVRLAGNLEPLRVGYSDDAIRHDPRWEHIRELAGKALEGLHDLGVITRELADPAYNTAVIEPR